MDNLLQQGVIAYKEGKRDEARKCFIAVIKQNQDNERAWQFMYNLANDDKERLTCLKQILRINPENEKAQQLLDKLTDFVPPLEHPNDHPQTQQPIQQQIQRPLDLAGDSNINALQKYADYFIKVGWTIASMSDRQFVATRRNDINGLVALIGVIGLFFYVIPGLLILLIGYVARGTKTRIATDAEAQAWLTRERQQAQKLQAEKEAKKAADNRKIAELSDSPLRYWYMMSSNLKIVLILAIIIFVIALFLGSLLVVSQLR